VILCALSNHLVVYDWRITDKYGGTCAKSKLYQNSKNQSNNLVGYSTSLESSLAVNSTETTNETTATGSTSTTTNAS